MDKFDNRQTRGEPRRERMDGLCIPWGWDKEDVQTWVCCVRSWTRRRRKEYADYTWYGKYLPEFVDPLKESCSG